MMAAYYPNNVTTDHIQQYLDENNSLILKIVESQNSGNLSECAENQARLQRNLLYLAAIADFQTLPRTVHAQFPPSGIVQPGAHNIQNQQAQQMTQPSLMATRSSMVYSQPPYSAMQQQDLHGQLSMSSGGSTNFQLLQNQAGNIGGGGPLGAVGFPGFGREGGGFQAEGGVSVAAGGSRQDIGSSAGSSERRGRQRRRRRDMHYLKSFEGRN